jgi:hypothetical protein
MSLPFLAPACPPWRGFSPGISPLHFCPAISPPEFGISPL